MLPYVKRKLSEVQLVNLKLTEEVERLENMLKLQVQYIPPFSLSPFLPFSLAVASPTPLPHTSVFPLTHRGTVRGTQNGINRDLHKELETLVRNRDKDKHELVEKAEAFEQLAIKRLEKIQTLEAQRRQYVYDVAKRRLAGGLPQATGAPLVVDALQVIKQPCSIFPSTHVLPSLSLSLTQSLFHRCRPRKPPARPTTTSCSATCWKSAGATSTRTKTSSRCVFCYVALNSGSLFLSCRASPDVLIGPSPVHILFL